MTGGHMASAKTIARGLRDRGIHSDIIDIDHYCDPFDILISPSEEVVRRKIGRLLFNIMAPTLWNYATVLGLPSVILLHRILLNHNYEFIISVTPHSSQIISRLIKNTHLDIPFFVIPTDIADPIGTRFYFNRKQYWFGSSKDTNTTYLLGSDRLRQQAESLGIKSIVPISGMVIDKKFSTKTTPKSLIRKDLGIPSDAKVVLFLFGSCASLEMVDLAKIMQQHPEYYCVFICGKSASVKAKIELLDKDKKYRVLGFVNNVDQWMQAADVCVGKPGPGIISECTSSCLPIVVKGGFDVMLQEKYNVEYITTKQIGKVLKDWNELPQAVTDIISNKEKYAEVFAAIPRNKALEEVCEYIERVVHKNPDKI